MSSSIAAVDEEIKIDIETSNVEDPKILLVDDNKSTLKLIKRSLKRLRNYEIVTESDPKKVLNKIDNSYDCIVSDYEMPDIDGLDLLNNVKNQHELPFILYTGKGSEEIASQAISKGVDNYLRKESGLSHFKMLAKQIDNNISQKRTEKALNKAMVQYKELLDSCPVPIVVSKKGEILYTNQEALQISDYESQTEIKGENLLDFIEPCDHEKVKEDIRSIYETGSSDISLIRCRSGGERMIVESKSSLIQFENGIAAQTALRNITAEKKAKKELKRTKKYLESLMEHLPVGVVIGRKKGQVLYINRQLISLFELDLTKEKAKNLSHENLVKQIGNKISSKEEYTEPDQSNYLVSNKKDFKILIDDERYVKVRRKTVEGEKGDWDIWIVWKSEEF